MQKLPKSQEDANPKESDLDDEKRGPSEEATEEGRKGKRSYYYDDAYGYEDYLPEEKGDGSEGASEGSA